MGARAPMLPPRHPESFARLQREIEEFVRSLERPVLVEDEQELFDLTAASWRLTVGPGKLLLEVWNPARSISRRVEEIAYRDRARIGLFVRKPGGRETSTLEFRSLERAERDAKAPDRARFRQELLGILEREFRGSKFERVSNRSDREFSFSTWYTRGWARQGRTAWAFLGLAEAEAAGAADGLLAFGLIWLDWLRARAERVTVPGLKLFLPSAALDVTAHRAACLHPRAVAVEVFKLEGGLLERVDLRDYGNVETDLVQRRQGQALAERHGDLIRAWVGDLADRVDLVPDASGAVLSLRVAGLEVARVEGQLNPRIYWGVQGASRQLAESHRAESLEFLKKVLEVRSARSQDPRHEYCRVQSERWLESLVVRDITKIDPALMPDFVYPQVPAFSGMDRGVIDILGATRRGRLAVIELKLQEEINLPMQGLDYWLRVKWLHERRQFQPAGYFPGTELSAASPLLYLVSPAFRFHSTTGRLIQYLDPSIEVVQVGLNHRWREGVKVLFRREGRALLSSSSVGGRARE
jgi:hypothetical protein